MSRLLLIVSLVLPVFLVIAAGYAVKRTGLIRREVFAGFSKLVFFLALPCLLFKEVSGLDLHAVQSWRIIIHANLITLVFFLLLWAAARLLRWPPPQQGVFIQGGYRSNMAFVGLALCLNAFGREGLAFAAVVLAFTIPIYNILAVVALVLPQHQGLGAGGWKKMLASILQNPLILAVAAGAVFSLAGWRLPSVVDKAVDLVRQIALPLALLSVGGDFEFGAFRRNLAKTGLTAAAKLVAYPALGWLVFSLFRLPPEAVRVAVVLLACPTAVSSYVMAREMRGDEALAGGIVMVTTLFSIVTLIAWLYILGVGR